MDIIFIGREGRIVSTKSRWPFTDGSRFGVNKGNKLVPLSVRGGSLVADLMAERLDPTGFRAAKVAEVSAFKAAYHGTAPVEAAASAPVAPPAPVEMDEVMAAFATARRPIARPLPAPKDEKAKRTRKAKSKAPATPSVTAPPEVVEAAKGARNLTDIVNSL